MASPAADWRYERKFYVTRLSLAQAFALLARHPAMFAPLYPPRHVNNIYFDDVSRRAYLENLDGIADRCKARIRWYGDLFGICNPVLELKIKRGLVGRKESHPVPALEVRPGLSRAAVRRVVRSAALPEPFRSAVASREPTLLNRYFRRYYGSADGRFRLTLDCHQEFRGWAGDRLSIGRRRDRAGLVFELKYGLRDDAEAERVAAALPFRVTRSSKYVAGLQRVH